MDGELVPLGTNDPNLTTIQADLESFLDYDSMQISLSENSSLF
jgi:hypothetical protein